MLVYQNMDVASEKNTASLLSYVHNTDLVIFLRISDIAEYKELVLEKLVLLS